VTFQDEAVAALRDPERAERCMLEFVAAIRMFLSDDDKAVFASCIDDALRGCVDGDEDVLRRLPMFDYVPRGDSDGVVITITFPDEDTA